jgi:hypothetical protein
LPPNFWSALEQLPGLAALPATWLDLLGETLSPFKNLCLETSTQLPEFVRCPRNCGCRHQVILRHDRTAAIGACICQPPSCPDIPLTIQEITPMAVNWTRLAFALCKALDCTPRLVDLGPFQTKQLGSWSTKALPLILTIQTDPHAFAAATAQLVADLKSPFILLAPTTINVTARAISTLKSVRAVFFDLHSHIIFDENGALKSTTPPDQLFAELSPHPSPAAPLKPKPRFSLRKHLGIWHLTFDGQEAFIRHERGLLYVHWLLYHPDETPIHAIDLMAKIPEIYRQQLGLPAITDPLTGKTVTLDSRARLQERSLALDDRQSMRALYKKQKELEALLDSDDASEPEKAEALRELEQLYGWQRHHANGSNDAANRTSHTVRTAIARLHQHLRRAADQDPAQAAVLRSFTEHVRTHILIPSGRYRGHRGLSATAGLGASLRCEAESGITWSD